MGGYVDKLTKLTKYLYVRVCVCLLTFTPTQEEDKDLSIFGSLIFSVFVQLGE